MLGVLRRKLLGRCDYSELERRVREIAPEDKYGYKNYLLSEEHPVGVKYGRLSFLGKFSFQTGYSCYDISRLVFTELQSLGAGPKLVTGKDSIGLFTTHFFCLDKHGNVIDGVPLYSFVGEKHTVEQEVKPAENLQFSSVTNPVTLYSDGDSLYLISLSVDKGKDIKIILSDSELCFKVGIHNVKSGECITYEAIVNLNMYRGTVKEDYRGFQQELLGRMHFRWLEKKGILLGYVWRESTIFDKPRPNNGLEVVLEKNLHFADALAHKVAFCQQN